MQALATSAQAVHRPVVGTGDVAVDRRCDRCDHLAHGSSSVGCRQNRPGRKPRLIAATPKTQKSLYQRPWPGPRSAANQDGEVGAVLCQASQMSNACPCLAALAK